MESTDRTFYPCVVGVKGSAVANLRPGWSSRVRRPVPPCSASPPGSRLRLRSPSRSGPREARRGGVQTGVDNLRDRLRPGPGPGPRAPHSSRPPAPALSPGGPAPSPGTPAEAEGPATSTSPPRSAPGSGRPHTDARAHTGTSHAGRAPALARTTPFRTPPVALARPTACLSAPACLPVSDGARDCARRTGEGPREGRLRPRLRAAAPPPPPPQTRVCARGSVCVSVCARWGAGAWGVGVGASVSVSVSVSVRVRGAGGEGPPPRTGPRADPDPIHLRRPRLAALAGWPLCHPQPRPRPPVGEAVTPTPNLSLCLPPYSAPLGGGHRGPRPLGALWGPPGGTRSLHHHHRHPPPPPSCGSCQPLHSQRPPPRLRATTCHTVGHGVTWRDGSRKA